MIERRARPGGGERGPGRTNQRPVSRSCDHSGPIRERGPGRRQQDNIPGSEDPCCLWRTRGHRSQASPYSLQNWNIISPKKLANYESSSNGFCKHRSGLTGSWLSISLEIVRWIIEIMQLRPGETLSNLHSSLKTERLLDESLFTLCLSNGIK